MNSPNEKERRCVLERFHYDSNVYFGNQEFSDNPTSLITVE